MYTIVCSRSGLCKLWSVLGVVYVYYKVLSVLGVVYVYYCLF